MNSNENSSAGSTASHQKPMHQDEPMHTKAPASGQDGQTRKHRIAGPCFLKMLVDDNVARMVIGKKGSVINSIASETGVSMRLSQPGFYFPGTSDRVVVMSGGQADINSAMFIILEKTRESTTDHLHGQSGPGASQPGAVMCKIVVPKSSVSAIIGKEGSQIKQLQETTGAKIQISDRGKESEEGLFERVIYVTGPLEFVKNAAMTIATSIQADHNLKDYCHVEYTNSNAGGDMMHNVLYPPPGGYPFNMYPFTPQYPGHNWDAMGFNCELCFDVPDHIVGSVIGKKRHILTKISQATNTRIIPRQKEPAQGASNESTGYTKLIISGAPISVHKAHIMFLRRIVEVQQSSRGSVGNSSMSGGSGSRSREPPARGTNNNSALGYPLPMDFQPQYRPPHQVAAAASSAPHYH